MGDIIIGHHGFDNMDATVSARGIWLQQGIFSAWDERVLALSANALPCYASSYTLGAMDFPVGVFNYGKALRHGGSAPLTTNFSVGWTPSRWRVFQFHFRILNPNNSRDVWWGHYSGYQQWVVKYNAIYQRLELWTAGPWPGEEDHMIAAGNTGLVGDEAWHYARMLVNTAATYDNPPSKFYLEVDGNIEWDVSGVDLVNSTGIMGISHLAFYGTYTFHLDIDNLLVIGRDDAEPMTEVYPEHRELAPRPIADDATMQWTPAGVVNAWDAVNDDYPDQDTTYIHSGTVGQEALFQLEPISAPYGILCWTQDVVVRKDNTENRMVHLASKIDGAITAGIERNILLSQSYLSRTRFMNQKPGGGTMTEADFNASRWGVKVVV
jgi:hypothetical protein